MVAKPNNRVIVLRLAPNFSAIGLRPMLPMEQAMNLRPIMHLIHPSSSSPIGSRVVANRSGSREPRNIRRAEVDKYSPGVDWAFAVIKIRLVLLDVETSPMKDPRPPRFGVRIPVAGPLSNPASISRSAREADRLGFDTLWVHDYLVWNRLLDSVHISCGSKEAFVEAVGRPDYEPTFYESITNLAYLAGITERIRLGIAVLCLPYREPLFTAKQLANIDVLSGGRLELGIGQGAAKSTHNVDFEVLGVDRATKVRHTREVFEAMREVWHQDVADYEGRMVRFAGAEIFPKPLQKPHPPIWMGGSAEKSLDMIADYADGWLSFWVSPEQFPKAIEDLHRRLESRGRSPEKFTIGTEIQVYLGDTVEKAQAEVQRTMLAFEEGYAGTTGILSDEGKKADTLAEIWNSSLIGSPQSVSDRINEYLSVGCTAFEMKFIYHNVDHLIEQWHRFTEEVVPKVAVA